ncbi:hypothetical protein J6590_039260 [Homalodisca vitripennis]|nr:hypothetical protein J6590_039260 [Homalodisca vitripennis]
MAISCRLSQSRESVDNYYNTSLPEVLHTAYLATQRTALVGCLDIDSHTDYEHRLSVVPVLHTAYLATQRTALVDCLDIDSHTGYEHRLSVVPDVLTLTHTPTMNTGCRLSRSREVSIITTTPSVDNYYNTSLPKVLHTAYLATQYTELVDCLDIDSHTDYEHRLSVVPVTGKCR